MTPCPVCGGKVIRCSHQGPGGMRHFSLCCRIPTEVLDNWEVIEGLPPELREQAITTARAAHDAIYEREREMAAEFLKADAELDERWPARLDLMKT